VLLPKPGHLNANFAVRINSNFVIRCLDFYIPFAPPVLSPSSVPVGIAAQCQVTRAPKILEL
jgi:hypothetical protein